MKKELGNENILYSNFSKNKQITVKNIMHVINETYGEETIQTELLKIKSNINNKSEE